MVAIANVATVFQRCKFCVERFKVEDLACLSGTLYSVISFRKSTSPQNRQLNIKISTSKQSVDYFVGELTF